MRTYLFVGVIYLKKTIIILSLAFLLCGCSKQDKLPDISAAYSGDIMCTASVQALSEPACDYVISFSRQQGTDSIEVLSPESVKGITARVERGSAAVTYEGKYLETLLPFYWGASPADALSALFDCLSTDKPTAQNMSDKEISLEYMDLSDNAEICRRAVLNRDDLSLRTAEVELDGQLILRLECTSLQVYPNTDQ